MTIAIIFLSLWPVFVALAGLACAALFVLIVGALVAAVILVICLVGAIAWAMVSEACARGWRWARRLFGRQESTQG